MTEKLLTGTLSKNETKLKQKDQEELSYYWLNNSAPCCEKPNIKVSDQVSINMAFLITVKVLINARAFIRIIFFMERVMGVYQRLEFLQMSLVVRKPVFGVSDQTPHKPGSTATQDG